MNWPEGAATQHNDGVNSHNNQRQKLTMRNKRENRTRIEEEKIRQNEWLIVFIEDCKLTSFTAFKRLEPSSTIIRKELSVSECPIFPLFIAALSFILSTAVTLSLYCCCFCHSWLFSVTATCPSTTCSTVSLTISVKISPIGNIGSFSPCLPSCISYLDRWLGIWNMDA